MRRIQVPLALPVIFAGIRTAAVQIVSAATLAAFIGGGGLGELITAGMGTLNIAAARARRTGGRSARDGDRAFFRRPRMERAALDRGRGMIRLENVSKTFPGSARPAVDRLDLDVPDGTTCVLIGPSGCGKTTTMRIVNRLIEPTSGRIVVEGQDVTRADAVELRRRIGYVIQQVGLFPHMTIAQNVATVPQLLGWPGPRIAQRGRGDAVAGRASSPPSSSAAIRATCRAGSASGSAWRARSPPTRRSC